MTFPCECILRIHDADNMKIEQAPSGYQYNVTLREMNLIKAAREIWKNPELSNAPLYVATAEQVKKEKIRKGWYARNLPQLQSFLFASYSNMTLLNFFIFAVGVQVLAPVHQDVKNGVGALWVLAAMRALIVFVIDAFKEEHNRRARMW
jgi:hypothetical protein